MPVPPRRARAPRRPDAPARRTRPGAAAGDGVTVLYGWHPVREALLNPRRRLRLFLATENGWARLAAEGIAREAPQIVPPHEISARLEPDAVHQGLYLEADPLEAPPLGAMPADALLLVLDQVTDPHNVGAILRSAAAFAVTAVVTTQRHSPAATGVLAKAASGGLEHVPIITVRNLGEALTELGEGGVLRIGLAEEGQSPLESLPLPRPLALVLGAEGKGLRQRTRALCDALARLDLPGAIRSLNVSNAAALALYVADRAQRGAPGDGPGDGG